MSQLTPKFASTPSTSMYWPFFSFLVTSKHCQKNLFPVVLSLALPTLTSVIVLWCMLLFNCPSSFYILYLSISMRWVRFVMSPQLLWHLLLAGLSLPPSLILLLPVYIPGSLTHWKSGTHPCFAIWKWPPFLRQNTDFSAQNNLFFTIKHWLFCSKWTPFLR